MTVQNVLSLENLVDVQAVLAAATRRVIELKNNLPSFPEVKKQAVTLKKEFKALVSDDSKFYNDDLTGRVEMMTNEDGSRYYEGSFKVIPCTGQDGVYDEDFGSLAGTPYYVYNYQPDSAEQSLEFVNKVLPKGWTTEVRVEKGLVHKGGDLVTFYNHYVNVKSPNFFK